MPEKDASNWSWLSGGGAWGWVTYALIAFWALVGGLVSFWQKVRSGAARWINLHELIGELVTSGFIGVTCGLLLDAFSAPLPLTFAAVGIAGHMGSRGIFFLEQLGKRWAEKHFGVNVNGDGPQRPLL